MPRRLLGEPGNEDDDRQDLETRHRIDELVDSLLIWQKQRDERSKRVVALVLLAIVLAFGAVIGNLALLKHVDSQANRNEFAMCALRDELAKRVASSQDFLVHHPHGAFGITPAQIQRSIKDTQRSIDALEVLSCSS